MPKDLGGRSATGAMAWCSEVENTEERRRNSWERSIGFKEKGTRKKDGEIWG